LVSESFNSLALTSSEMYRHSRVVKWIFNENVTEYSENKSRLNTDISIKKT